MKATHYDHQHNWWKYCECEDCRLTHEECTESYGGEYSYMPTNFKGGLHWDGSLSCFAHEPMVFFVRCYHCDKLYVALEPFAETPMLYPVSREEEDSLTGLFYEGD